MSDSIQITLDDAEAQAAFRALAKRTADMTPLTRRVAGRLAAGAETAFDTETSPDGVPWVDLSEVTKTLRAKRGAWPGQKLQVSGELAESVTTDFGKNFVEISSNVPYARIHQLGGKAGRNRKVTIPARPYLGVSDEAMAEIKADMLAWLDLRRFGGGGDA